MTGYYGKKLSGARLSEVYNTSIERVRQYLDQGKSNSSAAGSGAANGYWSSGRATDAF